MSSDSPAAPPQEGAAHVNLEVIPIRVPPSGVRCYLILFHEAPAPAAEAEVAPPATPVDPAVRESNLERQVGQLQQELAATRDYLQSIIEEHESTCEELKSASEEIPSSNEELQSTNEELQTAKEETQSVNEELSTLNEELHHRNLQLGHANNNFVNFLSAVDLPIVMVSRDLRARRFTASAEKVLNLIPSDVGRPIGHIKPNIQVNDLPAIVARVVDTLTPFESEVQDKDGHWYSLRIRPYITTENNIEGASITLLDIDTLRKQLEEKEKG